MMRQIGRKGGGLPSFSTEKPKAVPVMVFCTNCDASVPMLPAEQAAERSRAAIGIIRRLLGDGTVHSISYSNDGPMICIPSLMDAIDLSEFRDRY